MINYYKFMLIVEMHTLLIKERNYINNNNVIAIDNELYNIRLQKQ